MWQHEPSLLTYNTMNSGEHNILMQSTAEGGTYELFRFPKNAGRDATPESKRGIGAAAVFVERGKFAVLDKGRAIFIRDMRNEVTKKIPLPTQGIDGLFPAAVASRMILRSDEKLWLYEHTSRHILAELHAPRARRVSWNKNATNCAIMCKHAVIITDRDMAQLCIVNEAVHVKGGAWDESGVFVYTTLNHIKYLLPSGDGGIIRTMDEIVYIAAVSNGTIYGIDRQLTTRVIKMDTTEYRFKLALEKQRFRDVLNIIRTSTLCGSAIIAYLQKKGYPEVALHFVKDDSVKFDLALECGNIEVALEAAKQLMDTECWHRLGAASLRQGNHQVVEMAYQNTKNFEGLSFLYLITGNTAKLRKMSKIAEHRQDVMSMCHNAMYLGDIESNVNLFSSVGQTCLAYVTAATHKLDDQAAVFKEQLIAAGLPVPSLRADAKLLVPPTPIMREDNWPLLTVSRSVFDPSKMDSASYEVDSEGDGEVSDAGGGEWQLSDDDSDVAGGEKASKADDDDDGEGTGWAGSDSELELSDDDELGGDSSMADGSRSGDTFIAPTVEKPPAMFWSQSNLAMDHVVAGDFSSAMGLLHRQIGVVDFSSLRPHFLAVYRSVRPSTCGMPLTPTLMQPLLRNALHKSIKSSKDTFPRALYSLGHLVTRLKEAYKLFQKGKFAEAKQIFLGMLRKIPLVVVKERQEEAEMKELVGFCKEYLLFLKIDNSRKSLRKSNPKRGCEMAAYATHCRLQPAHMVLVLSVAMMQAYKLKNFIHAASFARRLIEISETTNGNTKARDKAMKVVKMSEAKARNAAKLDYDERIPFSVCGKTLNPIQKGNKKVNCPYCFTAYLPQYAKITCEVCGLAEVGLETIGLISFSNDRRR